MSTVLAPVSKRSAPASIADVAKILKPKTKRIADLVRTKRLDLRPAFGLDPEMMIFDTEQDRIVSSIPILKRDKHNPIDLGGGARFYSDNCLAEFSMPPETTAQALIKSMRVVFQRMQNHLGDRYRLIPKAAHEYPAEDLVPQHGVDPSVIGCECSYSAWDMAVNTPTPFQSGLRTGSFHLHLGHDLLKEFKHRIAAIKLLDLNLGMASVIFDRDETARARRQYYGGPSEHRLPDWGVEYRVMGPFALRSPALVELVIDIADHALNAMREGHAPEVIASIDVDEVKAAINTCDVKLARKVLKQIGFPAALMKRVEMDRGELDMYQEWGLKVLTGA